MTKLSVLVAAYNEEKFIKETLDSILAQNFSDYEVIIAENGSTDKTPEIGSKYAEEHENIHFQSIQEKGKNRAFNQAFRLAKGDYITFVGADDKLPRDSFSKRLNLLEAENDFATCQYETFSEDAKFDGIRYPKNPNLPNFTAGSLIFPRSIAKQVFPIPEDLPNEDSWSSLHLRAFGQNKHCSEVLYYYRIHAENSFGYGDSFESKRKKFLDRMRGFEKFYDKYKEEENAFIAEYLKYYVEGIQLAKSKKIWALMSFHKLPIGERLRFILYSNRMLFFIRNKFFRFFSGVNNS